MKKMPICSANSEKNNRLALNTVKFGYWTCFEGEIHTMKRVFRAFVYAEIFVDESYVNLRILQLFI